MQPGSSYVSEGRGNAGMGAAFSAKTQITALLQRVKHTGLVLVFIALLVLLGLAGASISQARQGAVPHGGLIAPGDPPVITHHTVAFGTGANNRDVLIGGIAASVGDIHVGSQFNLETSCSEQEQRTFSA